MKGILPQIMAVGLALSMLGQTALGSLSEASFWTDRQKSIETQRAASQHTQLASLPAALPAIRSISSASNSMKEMPGFFADESQTKWWVNQVPQLAQPYGRVEFSAAPGNKNSQQWLIHIQDVHSSKEGQDNIAGFISKLAASGEIDLMGLEGAFKPIDLDILRAFPAQEEFVQASQESLYSNQITGPIYFGLTAQKPAPPIVGVDDQKLYHLNVQAYIRSMDQKASQVGIIQELIKNLEKEKENGFNPALLDWDKKLDQYRSEKLNLGEHVKNIISILETLPENNFSGADGFPSIRQFHKSLILEKNLMLNKVEEERQSLLSNLIPQLSKDQQEFLLQASVQYKMGKISHSEFYSCLKNILSQLTINMANYPHFQNYMAYIFSVEKINGSALFDELNAAEKKVTQRLALSENEKQLAQKSEALYLIRKLVEFSLTPQEWQAYKTLSSKLNPNLDLSAFESFYENAQARDQAMANNLVQSIHEHNAQKIILVTGGFHAPGILKKLKKENFGVVTFTPKISIAETPEGAEYLSIFSQEKVDLDVLFTGKKLFLSQLVWTPASARALIINAAGKAYKTGVDGAKWKSVFAYLKTVFPRMRNISYASTEAETRVLISQENPAGVNLNSTLLLKNGVAISLTSKRMIPLKMAAKNLILIAGVMLVSASPIMFLSVTGLNLVLAAMGLAVLMVGSKDMTYVFKEIIFVFHPAFETKYHNNQDSIQLIKRRAGTWFIRIASIGVPFVFLPAFASWTQGAMAIKIIIFLTIFIMANVGAHVIYLAVDKWSSSLVKKLAAFFEARGIQNPFIKTVAHWSVEAPLMMTPREYSEEEELKRLLNGSDDWARHRLLFTKEFYEDYKRIKNQRLNLQNWLINLKNRLHSEKGKFIPPPDWAPTRKTGGSSNNWVNVDFYQVRIAGSNGARFWFKVERTDFGNSVKFIGFKMKGQTTVKGGEITDDKMMERMMEDQDDLVSEEDAQLEMARGLIQGVESVELPLEKFMLYQLTDIIPDQNAWDSFMGSFENSFKTNIGGMMNESESGKSLDSFSKSLHNRILFEMYLNSLEVNFSVLASHLNSLSQIADQKGKSLEDIEGSLLDDIFYRDKAERARLAMFLNRWKQLWTIVETEMLKRINLEFTYAHPDFTSIGRLVGIMKMVNSAHAKVWEAELLKFMDREKITMEERQRIYQLFLNGVKTVHSIEDFPEFEALNQIGQQENVWAGKKKKIKKSAKQPNTPKLNPDKKKKEKKRADINNSDNLAAQANQVKTTQHPTELPKSNFVEPENPPQEFVGANTLFSEEAKSEPDISGVRKIDVNLTSIKAGEKIKKVSDIMAQKDTVWPQDRGEKYGVLRSQIEAQFIKAVHDGVLDEKDLIKFQALFNNSHNWNKDFRKTLDAYAVLMLENGYATAMIPLGSTDLSYADLRAQLKKKIETTKVSALSSFVYEHQDKSFKVELIDLIILLWHQGQTHSEDNNRIFKVLVGNEQNILKIISFIDYVDEGMGHVASNIANEIVADMFGRASTNSPLSPFLPSQKFIDRMNILRRLIKEIPGVSLLLEAIFLHPLELQPLLDRYDKIDESETIPSTSKDEGPVNESESLTSAAVPEKSEIVESQLEVEEEVPGAPGLIAELPLGKHVRDPNLNKISKALLNSKGEANQLEQSLKLELKALLKTLKETNSINDHDYNELNQLLDASSWNKDSRKKIGQLSLYLLDQEFDIPSLSPIFNPESKDDSPVGAAEKVVNKFIGTLSTELKKSHETFLSSAGVDLRSFLAVLFYHWIKAQPSDGGTPKNLALEKMARFVFVHGGDIQIVPINLVNSTADLENILTMKTRAIASSGAAKEKILIGYYEAVSKLTKFQKPIKSMIALIDKNNIVQEALAILSNSEEYSSLISRYEVSNPPEESPAQTALVERILEPFDLSSRAKAASTALMEGIMFPILLLAKWGTEWTFMPTASVGVFILFSGFIYFSFIVLHEKSRAKSTKVQLMGLWLVGLYAGASHILVNASHPVGILVALGMVFAGIIGHSLYDARAFEKLEKKKLEVSMLTDEERAYGEFLMASVFVGMERKPGLLKLSQKVFSLDIGFLRTKAEPREKSFNEASRNRIQQYLEKNIAYRYKQKSISPIDALRGAERLSQWIGQPILLGDLLQNKKMRVVVTGNTEDLGNLELLLKQFESMENYQTPEIIFDSNDQQLVMAVVSKYSSVQVETKAISNLAEDQSGELILTKALLGYMAQDLTSNDRTNSIFVFSPHLSFATDVEFYASYGAVLDGIKIVRLNDLFGPAAIIPATLSSVISLAKILGQQA